MEDSIAHNVKHERGVASLIIRKEMMKEAAERDSVALDAWFNNLVERHKPEDEED